MYIAWQHSMHPKLSLMIFVMTPDLIQVIHRYLIGLLQNPHSRAQSCDGDYENFDWLTSIFLSILVEFYLMYIAFHHKSDVLFSKTK